MPNAAAGEPEACRRKQWYGQASAMSGDPLRLLVYDRTCLKHGVGLSTAWSSGAALYRALRRIDASRGVASWEEALAWLGSYDRDRAPLVAEIQFWGHGKWGRVFIGKEGFDEACLDPSHAHAPAVQAVKARLLPESRSLVWIRTCEAFGAIPGQRFAVRLAKTLAARVAGHTFIIGALQSGLRALRPGCVPTWSPAEGLAEGTPDEPTRALNSWPHRPRTISCFDNDFPEAWFDEDGRA
jgi:hypothetical protein